MNRILLINKPKGMTSFQVVSTCRRKLKEKKAGHSGTLDPNAEGLMIVAFGKYTKLLPYVVSNRKHYIATFSLGKKYDTQDVWGKVIDEKQYTAHAQSELDHIGEQFIGNITQVPPMYSALKKDGKKLYEYARRGIKVERKARDVSVERFEVKQIGDNLYSLDAIVSSGTYIRTLIEDYCDALNEYGYMVSLLRTGIEDLDLKDAVSIDDIDENLFFDPFKMIDRKWKIIQADDPDDVRNGKIISVNSDEKNVILVDGNDILAAYEKRDDGLYHCVRGLY